MKRRVLALASTFVWAAIYLPAGVATAQNADQGGQGTTSGANGAAQTAQGDGAQTAGSTLQEVVVTAERRAISEQQTPIVVEAISGPQLLDLHLNNMDSLQTTVPTFEDNNEGAFTTVNIRGIGNSGTSVNVENGVVMLRDGLLMPEPLGNSEPFFDLADIEVLEGPQGTLVGAASTGGSVEINSANPSLTGGFHGYILGSLATYSDNKWQGAVNLPVSDTFAARFAFNDETRNSFYHNLGSSDQGYFINSSGAIQSLNQGLPGVSNSLTDPGDLNAHEARVKLLWKPTDNFQALADIEYSLMTTDGQAEEPNPLTYKELFVGTSTTTGCTAAAAGTNYPGAVGTQLSCPLPGVSSHSTYYYPGETPLVLDYYQTNPEQNQYLWHYSAELRYTLPDGIVVRSLSGYVAQNIPEIINSSFGPQNTGVEYHTGEYDDDYYSEEINIISPTTGKVNWLLGGLWDYRATPDYTTNWEVPAPYQPNALPTTLAITQTSGVTRLAGLFGNVNWQFTNALQLQVGARENWDNNFSLNTIPVAPAPGTVLSEPNGTGTYKVAYTGTTPSSYTVVSQDNETGTFKDSVPTGKVDLDWTPATGQNFYFFVARGYQPGGVNTSSVDHPTFSPATDWDYETGWKGSLFDGHMLTQVGLYYMKFIGLQYTLYDTEASNDTTTGTYTANLAPSTIEGIEVSEQSRFGGLGFNVGFDYNHSALGAVSAVNSALLPPGFGNPLAMPQCLPGHTYTGYDCFNYAPYSVNISGEQNPFSPQVTLNLTLDYQFHLGNGIIDPKVVYSYMSKQYASVFEIPYLELGARNLLSATVDWVVGDWDVQLFGTNLTNLVYVDGVSNGAGDAFYGDPRQLGLQITRKF